MARLLHLVDRLHDLPNLMILGLAALAFLEVYPWERLDKVRASCLSRASPWGLLEGFGPSGDLDAVVRRIPVDGDAIGGRRCSLRPACG
jgi:hypothetical protein